MLSSHWGGLSMPKPEHCPLWKVGWPGGKPLMSFSPSTVTPFGSLSNYWRVDPAKFFRYRARYLRLLRGEAWFSSLPSLIYPYQNGSFFFLINPTFLFMAGWLQLNAFPRIYLLQLMLTPYWNCITLVKIASLHQANLYCKIVEHISIA